MTKTPFHFKVLRYIHDSFTGEFLNVGLAMLSPQGSFFKVRLLHKYARITGAFPTADGEHYRHYITSLQTKFDILSEAVDSKQLTFTPVLPDTLDALLATVLPPDDSAVQFGPVQGGMAADLDAVFTDLYYRLVEAHIAPEEHLSRNEQDIWNLYSRPLRGREIIQLLRSTVIRTPKDDVELEHAWKNGHWKALQPISFDLQNPGSIKKKAYQWLGTSVILNESSDVSKIYYLLGQPRRDDASLRKAYTKAKDLLGSHEYVQKIELIEEDAAEDFARGIGSQIQSDTQHE